MEKFNYKLEIKIFRNSTLKNLGVLRAPCWLRPYHGTSSLAQLNPRIHTAVASLEIKHDWDLEDVAMLTVLVIDKVLRQLSMLTERKPRYTGATLKLLNAR